MDSDLRVQRGWRALPSQMRLEYLIEEIVATNRDEASELLKDQVFAGEEARKELQGRLTRVRWGME